MTRLALTFYDSYRSLVRGKTRIGLAWIFAAWMVLTTRENPQWPGILVCFFGASLRFWASGYLRKDSEMSIGGPYRWTRNPLYLGTYLMAVGAALAAEQWAFALFVSVAFASVYRFIIQDEEAKLLRLFGETYRRYLEVVPRFFPLRGRANDAIAKELSSQEGLRFSWAVAMQNKAFEAYYTWAALVGFMAILAAFWQHYSG